MPENETLNRVRDLMIDVFNVDDLTLSPSTTAADIDEWDSLHHIRLIIAIERKFKVKFKNSEVEALKNVGDLIKLIDQKLGR